MFAVICRFCAHEMHVCIYELKVIFFRCFCKILKKTTFQKIFVVQLAVLFPAI